MPLNSNGILWFSSEVKFSPIYITIKVFNFVNKSRPSNYYYFIESCVSFPIKKGIITNDTGTLEKCDLILFIFIIKRILNEIGEFWFILFEESII